MTRERIVEYIRVRAGDLRRHPKNWRKHPGAQREALVSMLILVGNVAPLFVFRERDGECGERVRHLRADIRPDEEIEVAVTDLTEEEADLVLATFDPISSLAQADEEKLRELRDSLDGDLMEEIADLLDQLVPPSLDEIYSGENLPGSRGERDPSDAKITILCPHHEKNDVLQAVREWAAGCPYQVVVK